MSRHIRMFLSAGLGLLLLLGVVPVRAEEEEESGSLEGEPAAVFSLKTLEGQPYGLKDAASGGRPVFLYFCSAWCKDCLLASPKVNEIHHKYGNRLKVLAVNTTFRGDTLNDAIEYKRRHSLDYTTVFDEKNEVTDRYMVFGTPLFVLVDPQGIVRYRANMLPQDLDKLLK